MARLTLTFFGPFQAALAGKPVLALRSPRIQALLAYLVLEAAHPHARETLATLLWPDEPAQVAKQNLRQALYQLRQALDETDAHAAAASFLLVTRDTVQFNSASDYTLDVAIFLQALQEGRRQTAVDIYTADLLIELASGSEQFEEWLLIQREQLRLLALHALHQLTEQALAEAAYADAQQLARRQLTLEPWREEAHRQLIFALAAVGEQRAALAQFETCRELLHSELGVEPEAETRTLMERVRRGDLPGKLYDLRERSADQTFATLTAQEEHRPSSPESLVDPKLKIQNRVDWGDAPDIGVFYGREPELQELRRWLIDQRCRLIAVLGMGGMGKTTLTAQLVRQQVAHFDFVLWHSLLNAPTLRELLDNWLRALSAQPLAQSPTGLDAQLNLLFDYLRQHRCLLVLDNAESIMQGADALGARAGYYQAGYEEYGQLLLRIGQSSHQSCLLLTSREQPRELSRLSAETPLVRTLVLPGLDDKVGRQLLRAHSIQGSGESVAALVERYSGNPLALKLVAETIQEFFAGDIDALLGEQTLIFDDIRDVLEQQFTRLTPLERELLLWLAIEREPVTENQLWQRFARTTSKRSFLEALRSLLHRSLVENFAQERQAGGFGLQNVVTEFLTDYLITQICQEFASFTPALLHSHALLSTQAKEYVRQSQERIILQSIGERLLAAQSRTQLAAQGKQLLEAMRHDHPLQPSFLAGNLLNLFLHLNIDLRGYDFSHLSVWQAYLRGADLPGLNFSQADLTGSVFTDYAGAVTAVAFSPDGQLLAAGADSGVIYLWRVVDRQLLAICQGHTSHVWSLVFSPDGQQLLSGSSDATVRLWDVASRQLLRRFVGHIGVVASVGFHPSGEYIVSGGLDQEARIWNTATGQLLQTLETEGAKLEAVAFSPDGMLLATGGHDQVVRLWDWPQAQVVRTLRGHTNLIKVVGFCPQPQWLNGVKRMLIVSGGDDQTLRVWDAITGELVQCCTGHTAAIISLAFSPDGLWLLSGSDDQTIRVWDLQSGQTVRILHGHYGTVRSLAVQPHNAPDQALLASGSYDKSVRLWEWKSGRTLAILRGHSKWLQALVFKPNAQGQAQLLVSGSDGQTVRVWDGNSGQVLHTLRGHTSLTEKITFRPDGAQLASASWDQTVRIWDLSRGQLRYLLRGHAGVVATAMFGLGPQGRRFIATGGLDRTVRLWNGEMGQPLAIWHGHRDRIVGFAFRPDGSLLASASWDSTIGLWDLQREEFLTFLRGHTETVESIAFHPGGDLLASASWDRSVRIWDIRTGQSLHVLQGHHDGLEMVTFSPDGTLLASCGCDHLICLWDVQSGRLLDQLQGHTSWVRCIAFSPDSATLASGSDDGTVKLWAVGVHSRVTRDRRCLQTIALEDPYTGMNITGITGINEAQQAALQALGAVEE